MEAITAYNADIYNADITRRIAEGRSIEMNIRRIGGLCAEYKKDDEYKDIFSGDTPQTPKQIEEGGEGGSMPPYYSNFTNAELVKLYCDLIERIENRHNELEQRRLNAIVKMTDEEFENELTDKKLAQYEKLYANETIAYEEHLTPTQKQRLYAVIHARRLEKQRQSEVKELQTQFRKLTEYACRVNSVCDWDDFRMLVGKTNDMLNKIRRQIDKDIIKFLKKNMYDGRTDEVMENMVEYLNDNYDGGTGSTIHPNIKYCMRRKEEVMDECDCCNYADIEEQLYLMRRE